MFSIICSTFNQADFLPSMLESVKVQTCTDYELIVIDDGSTDTTPNILHTWIRAQPAEMKSRIKTLRTDQTGQSTAWEEGFALSSGRWICFLDSDDIFMPGKLETLAKVVDAHPEVGLIQHPLLVIDEFGNKTGDIRPQSATLSTGDLRSQMLHDGRHVAPGASGLAVSRETMQSLLPMPTKAFRFAADFYISFGATATVPIVALHEALALYRMQPGGQYLKRMLDGAGLVKQVEFQRIIADRFGLLDATRRNSFFCRNVYACRRFNGLPGTQKAFVDLLLATAHDTNFSKRRRMALITFWAISGVLPRQLFKRFWRAFQIRQTGWNRIAGGSPSSRKLHVDGPCT